jgi:hypothetical protein
MYLGQGLLATSSLQPGQRVTNSYALRVPDTAVAPAELQIATGLYDFTSGERLLLPDGQDTAVIARLPLAPAPGETPNPVDIDFEGQLLLSGYEVAPRRVVGSETLELKLYWQAAETLPTDYTFFAQIVDEDTTRWASQDLTPQPGTNAWPPGEVMELDFTLTLATDTPAGLYPLIVGVYTQDEEGDFDRLQLRTEDGRLTDDFLELTRIRVD